MLLRIYPTAGLKETMLKVLIFLRKLTIYASSKHGTHLP
jgi:hypothetical protein